MRALVQPTERGGKRPVVIEWAGHHHHVVVRRSIAADVSAQVDARTAGQDQFRPARRAAGGRGLPDRGGAVFQRVVAVGEGEQSRDVEARLVRSDRLARDQDRRLRQLHHRGRLERGQAVGDRLRCRADLPQAVAGLDEIDAVGEAQSDEVARLRPGRLETARDPVGAAVELGPGDGAMLVGDRGPVRPLRRQFAQARSNRDDGFAHSGSSFWSSSASSASADNGAWFSMATRPTPPMVLPISVGITNFTR